MDTEDFAINRREARTESASVDMPLASVKSEMFEKPVTSIIAVATKGTGSNEETRLRELLSHMSAEFLPFDRTCKLRSGWNIFKSLMRQPDLMVLEGTGIAVGLPCIAARVLRNVPYVVSSGDAVGPYVRSLHPILGLIFSIYERLLYRLSAGVIGWTPYLVGRALTFGAPRGITAAGWGPPAQSVERRNEARDRLRAQWSVGANTIVFGIVGSLLWNDRVNYCYGSELIRAIKKNARSPRVAVVIAGSGTGFDHLKSLAGDRLGQDIHLVGNIPAESVADYLAAFDVGSLPQSLDGVGNFRYTTKLSEYLAASLPVVTGQIPMSYDLDDGWLWRLPGFAPWVSTYIESLSSLMLRISCEDVNLRRQHIAALPIYFDRQEQVRRVTDFMTDLIFAKKSSAQ